jgi:transcriptional regulator with XRE-family HTH domain
MVDNSFGSCRGLAKLSEIVCDARGNSGLSLREFAELCVRDDGKSLNFNTVSRIERGAFDYPPNLVTLQALARNPYIKYSAEELAAICSDDGEKISLRVIKTSDEAITLIDQMPEEEKLKFIVDILDELPMRLKRDYKKQLINKILNSL